MNITGMNAYTRTTAYTPAKTSKATFCDKLQKAQNTDTFTRTAPVDLSIADTQLKLDKVAAGGRAVDYSGMTKAEIFAEIENRYKEAFDDFYMAKSLHLTKEHIMISNQYDDELRQMIGLDGSAFELYVESHGYTGMSTDEIANAIKEKYAGKTGFKDQLNLFGELWSAGVLSEKYGHHTAISMITDIEISMGCIPAKSNQEFFGGIDPNTSAFDMLMNNEYVPAAHKEVYERIIEDILFGIPPFAE